MKFKYVGPHDAVDIPGVGTVKHGETVTVDDKRGAGLAGQAGWEEVVSTKAVEAASNEGEGS